MVDFPLVHRARAATSGSPPHPGLLLLHGRGADEADLLPLAQYLSPELTVLTARAPLPFPWGGHAWYELDSGGIGYPAPASLQASLDLLQRFLDVATHEYDLDPKRLYTGGFSMGAVMAGTLALLDPNRIAGAAMLSGYLPLGSDSPFRLDEAAGHPFFVAHGVHDDLIPVSFGRQTRDHLAETAVDLTYREYPWGHQIGPEEVSDLSTWMGNALAVGPSGQASA